jgi:hypothetical protein
MGQKTHYLWFLFVGLVTDTFTLYPAAGVVREVIKAAQQQSSLFEKIKAAHSLLVNPLLIFMDSSEKKMGPLSISLLRALESEAAPIITTRYLLNQVTVSEEDIALMKAPEWDELVNKFNQLDPRQLDPRQIDPRQKLSIADPTRAELLLSLYILEKKEFMEVRFNNTNPGSSFVKEKTDTLAAYPFLIKQISDDLYLLLPKKYLARRNKELTGTIFHSVIEKKALQDPLTELEYTLGLRINHMKNSTLKEVQSKKAGHDEHPFIALHDFLGLHDEHPFIGLIDTLFVKKADYFKIPSYKEGNKSIPKQALFFMGHGGYNTSVSGLSLTDFSLFLEKLRLVPMHLLSYLSCYTSGKNQQSIFRKEGKDRVFDFPIMSFTIGDDSTGFLMNEFNFEKFVAEAAKKSPDFFQLGQAFPSNGTPQIRKAGLSWFFPLDVKTKPLSDEKIQELLKRQELPLQQRSLLPKFISPRDPASVVEITETMARTRTKDLIIKSPPVKHVLFSQQSRSPFSIPFKMILSSDGSPTLPFFRSLMPGDAVHYLVGIESEISTITDIVRSFLGNYLEGKKLYSIESIKAPVTKHMKELLQLQEAGPINLENVIIYTFLKRAYFKFRSQWYVIPLSGEESLASEDNSLRLSSDFLEKNASSFKEKFVKAKRSFFVSEKHKNSYQKFVDRAHILNIELFLGDRKEKLGSLKDIFKEIDFKDNKKLYQKALEKLKNLKLSEEEVQSYIMVNPSAQALEKTLIQEKAAQNSWFSTKNLYKKIAETLGAAYQFLRGIG